MIKRLTSGLVSGVLAAAFALSMGVANAQPHDHDHDRGEVHERPRGFDHYDNHFGHNQYYPSRGFAVHDLPRDRVIINGPRGRYFYSGGIWYSPGPRGYVVIGAPIGLFVPVLPPYYTTVWAGGVPYYYANDTYYTWRQSDSQYEVVAPPDESGASMQPPAPPPGPGASDDIYVYPKSGQSEEDQSRDKYECHKWAQTESGFDPTQPSGGVSPDQTNSKRAAYNRAMGACLEGRGYTVK
jgi:hypothetical protein